MFVPYSMIHDYFMIHTQKPEALIPLRVGAEQNEKWVEMDGRSRTWFFCLEILGGRKTDHAKSGIDELHKDGLKVLEGFH